MRKQNNLSIEQRRVAIQKEIEAIAVDIERVRSLANPGEIPEAGKESQHGHPPLPSRPSSRLN